VATDVAITADVDTMAAADGAGNSLPLTISVKEQCLRPVQKCTGLCMFIALS
jgi:hypothetical protein